MCSNYILSDSALISSKIPYSLFFPWFSVSQIENQAHMYGVWLQQDYVRSISLFYMSSSELSSIFMWDCIKIYQYLSVHGYFALNKK